MTITTNETKTVQVVSVAPSTTPDHHMVLRMSRRSTKENPVKTEERYRAIIIHSAQLQLPDGATTSKFAALLQATIHDLAEKKFAAWAVENLSATQVDPLMFNLDTVISYWAEEKRASQIDGKKIEEWLKGSKTYEALSEETKKVWLAKIPKIAAPSYGGLFTKQQAATIMSKMHADDLEHTCAAFIASRCNKIITTEAVEEAL